MTGCFLFMGIILINKIKNIIICGEWLRKIYLEFWLVCAKCSQLVLLHSSNSVEKLCGEWVLSASVCGTGSFCAHTATQLNERKRPMRNKLFVLNYGNYSYLFRCTSYINNAADTAAFNDSSSPSIGMITFYRRGR